LYASFAIDKDAAATRKHVLALGKRYETLRTRLSQRARNLYMHPGAAIDGLLGVRTIHELGRARILGRSVLTADSKLVTRTEQARRKLATRMDKLSALRGAAEAKEGQLAQQRSVVATQYAAQRSLLSNVKGEIATLIEQQRQQALAAAATTTPQGGGTSDTPKAKTPPGDPDANAKPPAVDWGASQAVAIARAQLGKPYVWAADGPDSFDCSGLTMYAWGKVGIPMIHFAESQHNQFPRVPKTQLQPGDLVFFGDPIHHVGIYEGGGIMINAPESGENVRRNSIYRTDYAGASRPTR
jgi:peptidoglycan DL-endopeptidase CwlO